MRVLLIRPPSKERYQGYFPLGLAYIAGYLLRYGHDVSVWDLDAERGSKREVIRRIRKDGGSYQIIGISALAADYPYVAWISRTLKRLLPQTKIILGGYLASALPRFLMEHLPLDILVVGEGEETIVELTEALTSGSDPGHVRGIYWRDDSGEIHATPARARLEKLDGLPFPPWELFPMEAYLKGQYPDEGENAEGNGTGVISIMASRGCPFDCNYCDHTIKGYRPRYRSIASVIGEIKALQEKYGSRIDTFYFWDDILIWDRNWIQGFCETLLREGMNVKWTCNCHVNRVEPRLMSLMKRAGCVHVRFGIESGSQWILDALGKGVKVEDAQEALRICLDAGLGLTLYTMVGMTGECRETIEETVEFFTRLLHPLYSRQILSISFFMLTPFPGTRLFERLERDGRLGDIARFLERDCDAYDDVPLNISGQTDETLARLKEYLEEKVLRMLRDSKQRLDTVLHEMAGELRA